jgi:hypothetical protein
MVEQCAVSSDRVQTESVIFDIPQQFVFQFRARLQWIPHATAQLSEKISANCPIRNWWHIRVRRVTPQPRRGGWGRRSLLAGGMRQSRPRPTYCSLANCLRSQLVQFGSHPKGCVNERTDPIQPFAHVRPCERTKAPPSIYDPSNSLYALGWHKFV